MCRSLRVFDKEGRLLSNSLVVDAGFSVGMQVVRKADEVSGTIVDISADKVKLRLAGGKLREASSEAFVQGKWKKYNPKTEPVKLNWWPCSPLSSQDFVHAAVKGYLLSFLHEQFEELMKATRKQVEVYVKPGKDVKVTSQFGVGALKLSVATNRVDFRLEGESLLQGAIRVGLTKGVGPNMKQQFVVSILPAFNAQNFANPAWAMKCSADREEANMELRGPNNGWDKQRLGCSTASIALPVFENYKALEAGESLIYFSPHTRASHDVETLTPVSKKARTQT